MCVPCVIIINGCGTGNNAAESFVNANEQFAEAITYMVDNGTLSEADGRLVTAHCTKYAIIAAQLDAFTAQTLALGDAIARRTPNPHSS